MKFTDAQKQTIKIRIGNYRTYDKKRFGKYKSSINYEQWLELYIEQAGKCYWTGMPMTISEGLPTDASLDRLDCNLPHTQENCVLVHKSMNLGRNDASVLEWAKYLNMCGLLAEEHKKDLANYLTNENA